MANENRIMMNEWFKIDLYQTWNGTTIAAVLRCAVLCSTKTVARTYIADGSTIGESEYRSMKIQWMDAQESGRLAARDPLSGWWVRRRQMRGPSGVLLVAFTCYLLYSSYRVLTLV